MLSNDLTVAAHIFLCLRVQKTRTQTDNNSNLLKEQLQSGSLAPDALGKMLKAMEELDAPENMPKGLNPSIWERFCLVRRTKVDSEQKVKCEHGQVKDRGISHYKYAISITFYNLCTT